MHQPKTVTRLFAYCSSVFPEHTAIRDGAEALNYSELDARAKGLAARLASMGSGRGRSVGLCMERSSNLIIAILAILKTGAAYVPLDHDYPAERLRFMIADSEIDIIVVSGNLSDAFSDFKGTLVRMDPLNDSRNMLSGSFSSPEIDEEDPAYIMYTSGSTGRPKGVVIPHRAIIRLVCDTDYLPFGPDLVFLLMSSISFDASTFEMWGPLLNGGTCVIYPPGLPDFKNLAESIRRHGIRVLWLTAALFNAIVDETPELLLPVDFILTGGEALSVPHVRKALKALPGVQLYNGYGPTENTTFTCCYPIPKNLPETISSIPIGKPIAGTYVVLLDKEGRRVPEGKAGELHIGGEGLALEYLNLPKLTAEAFIADPEPGRGGGILYKSGDLSRLLPDGNFEFLGRRDEQLKIRGHRIEPGEIEHKILENHDVGAAAVVPRRRSTRKTSLAAFVSSAPGKTVTVHSIEDCLTRSLPRYMIPESIVILEKLPVLPSGKIDRQALQLESADTERNYQTDSAGSQERLIAGLLGEILETRPPASAKESVAIDSLDAVRLVSRLKDEGFELDYGTLFSAPSVSGIASALIPNANLRPDYAGVVEKRRGRGVFAGLTSVQRSVYFLEKLRRGNPAYRFQAAVHFRGDLRIDLLQRALDTIIQRHEILRTTFPERDGTPVQMVHPPWKTDIPIVDLQDTAVGSIEYWNAVNEFLSKPLDLEDLPLICYRIFRIHQGHHVLVSTEHHLIHDGHSFGVMLSEVVECYRAYFWGSNPELPDIAWQYGDFACYEENLASGQGLARHIRYWKAALRNAPASSTITPERPRPAIKNFKGRRIDFFLDWQLSNALRKSARDEGVSLFSFMLAGFFALVYGLTDQKDLIVGTGSANRELESIQGTLGMFVNTLPIRIYIEKETFARLSRRVNKSLRSAMEHQSLPITQILQAAGTGTIRGETPMIDMMFSFHNSRIPDLEFPGLETELEYLHNKSAKYDINVIAIPDPRNIIRDAGAEASEDGTIFVMWEYSTEAYTASRMTRIVDAFVSLMKTASSCTESLVPDLARESAAVVNRIRTKEIFRKTIRRFLKVMGARKLIRAARDVRNKAASCKGSNPFRAVMNHDDSRRIARESAVQMITEMWKDLLGRDFIGPGDDFFKSGGDSLSSVVFCSRFKSITGIDLPLSSFFAKSTPEELATIALESRVEVPNIELRENCGGPVLFLFHGDFNGGGFYARSLAEAMPPGFGIVCLNPHGQLGRPMPKTVESMAEDFLEVILRHESEGPYFLAGHCNGGIVAFETARRLRSRGKAVGGLFLMDPATPSLTGVRPNADKRVARYVRGNTKEDFADMNTGKRITKMTSLYRKIFREYAVGRYDEPVILYFGWNSKAVSSGVEEIFKEAVPLLETEIVSGNHQTMVTEHSAVMADKIGKRILATLESYPENPRDSPESHESSCGDSGE